MPACLRRLRTHTRRHIPKESDEEFSGTGTLVKVAAAGKKGITFSAIGTEEGSFQFLPWFWGAGANLTALGLQPVSRRAEPVDGLGEEGLRAELGHQQHADHELAGVRHRAVRVRPRTAPGNWATRRRPVSTTGSSRSRRGPAGDVATVTGIEQSLGISPRPIAIEEYAAPSQVGIPGAPVGHLAKFERLGVHDAYWRSGTGTGPLATCSPAPAVHRAGYASCPDGGPRRRPAARDPPAGRRNTFAAVETRPLPSRRAGRDVSQGGHSRPPWVDSLRCGQAAVSVHSLLVLPLGDHITVVEPAVVLPAPSRAVPVPRLMIW